MEGGIRAWEGLMAGGAPEAGMAYFTPGGKPEEFIALAWALEEGSRKFYSEIPALVADDEVKRLFQQLTAAEEHHKASLVHLYKTFSGREPGPAFPWSDVAIDPVEDVMEGGMRVSEALGWMKGKSFEAIFELAIALETNAFDLYIKMSRQMKDDESRQVFDQLSREEKKHLELLTDLFEKKY